MLKRHSQFFKSLLFLSDLLIIIISWWLAYYLRFYWGAIPVYHGVPPLRPYLLLILPILVIWALIFKMFNLYRPRRISSHLHEVIDVAKASTLAVMVIIATTYFFRRYEFSRLVFIYFWLLSIGALSLSRATFREVLRFFRRKGYNLRHIVIIGDGLLARDVVQRIKKHPELGLNILGLFSSSSQRVGKRVHGKEIIGTFNDIRETVKEQDVDQVFVALPFPEMEQMDKVIASLDDEAATIKIIPDFYHFIPFCGSVEEFEGLPIFNLHDTPLYGWSAVVKRCSDIVVASAAIFFTFPVMVVIAIISKLTSPGPVLYKQRRAGLDGKAFNLYKFRTMRIDAEQETGPVWSKENDPRRTRFGAFLRRTSLDELPQFFNVLKGDMSVVGPRPERPEFIQSFQQDIPRYLLRHKMKAGITGWAQVNGWRGNTSLKERIKHDLYYIEHWNIAFDLKIIWLTIWKGFVHKHAY